MILVTCLNPALDITYAVNSVALGCSHRVTAVTARAGGKGTNVARVISQLGGPATLLAPAGGATGRTFTTELEHTDIQCAFTALEGETRRTVTVTSPESTTVFNEPGPEVSLDEWADLCDRFGALVTAADVVVLTGSLPPGVPVDAYGQLTTLARDAGSAVILDADGPAMRAALAAGPTIVKVNASEAAAALHTAHPSPPDEPRHNPLLDAPSALIGRGARAAVVTHGPEGLVAVVGRRHLRAYLPTPIPGNPTGAGDALTAVLAVRLAVGGDWSDVLARAVAVSGATLTVPYAGAYDTSLAARLLKTVVVKELT